MRPVNSPDVSDWVQSPATPPVLTTSSGGEVGKFNITGILNETGYCTFDFIVPRKSVHVIFGHTLNGLRENGGEGEGVLLIFTGSTVDGVVQPETSFLLLFVSVPSCTTELGDSKVRQRLTIVSR